MRARAPGNPAGTAGVETGRGSGPYRLAPLRSEPYRSGAASVPSRLGPARPIAPRSMVMPPLRPSPRRTLPVLLLLTLAACAAGGGARRAPAVSPEEAAIARARADSAKRPYTVADIDFMSGMIGHHAQAIVMAGMAESHEASPAVRTLAARIINAQSDEIAIMQRWLADRRLPVPPAVPGPMRMRMGGMEHEMLMPGMLAEEQLRQLDAARGVEFDRRFLTFMIQHHAGAITMVKALFAQDGAGLDDTVFKFASDVNVDQATEIARMERMLLMMRLEQKIP